MSPEGGFYDLHKLASWVQYTFAAKSLLAALELDDPEETLMVQLTVSELSLMSFSLLILSRIFPEFMPIANDLSAKVSELSDAQNFLRGDILDNE